VDEVLGDRELDSAVDALPPSGNNLSLAKVSICANLSSADDTLFLIDELH
jgi:hypothetical protein